MTPPEPIFFQLEKILLINTDYIELEMRIPTIFFRVNQKFCFTVLLAIKVQENKSKEYSEALEDDASGWLALYDNVLNKKDFLKSDTI